MLKEHAHVICFFFFLDPFPICNFLLIFLDQLSAWLIFVDCYSGNPLQEENLRDKPGYEHLSEPLHVLIEAEQPANIIDMQLNYAREMIEDLLKPVVRY